ncbi:MAG: D-2-hydroxyacid dehydrogenase [Muribaculaceae bacterium]|nr:D-2-hydroxyacid dehydrogenase [Muribaculaceae bacterium]
MLYKAPSGVEEIKGAAPAAATVVLDGFPLYPPGDSRWEAFAAFGPLAVYERTLSPEETVERCREARVVFTNKVELSAATLRRLPNVKYIGILATGTNIVDLKAAAAQGITATNIPSYSTASVAQTAISLLLAITNRVEYYSEAVREGRWTTCRDFTFRDFPLTELAGRNFAVVGFGHTGQATARIAAAFGMKVKVFTSKPQESLPEGYEKLPLDELFRRADVLSFHCPLTDSTRGMLDARRLGMMKPTAIVLNTSRGPVVDEQALADALNDERIAAAGLDVLSSEPPLPDNPLLKARNCIITPHIAWASEEARERLMEIALANLRAWEAGRPQNVVG